MALPGFKPFQKDKSGGVKNYVNENTGEVLSRRQYDKLRRPGFTNESLRDLNKQVEPERAAARPARGKASLLKLPEAERKRQAARRVENERLAREREKAQREARAILDKVEREKKKKRKAPKITARLLTPGAMGRTVEFEHWSDYERMFEEAKATRKVFSYGLGIVGVNANTGKVYKATVWKQMGFDTFVDEDEFYEGIEAFMDAHPYIELTGYFMHLAFNIEYAKQKRAAQGDQRKNKPGRKPKRR